MSKRCSIIVLWDIKEVRKYCILVEFIVQLQGNRV
jgi:hypothetical protein